MENTRSTTEPYIPQSRVESLKRAITGQSFTNFPAIFNGFIAKGIAESEIKKIPFSATHSMGWALCPRWIPIQPWVRLPLAIGVCVSTNIAQGSKFERRPGILCPSAA